MEFYFHSWSGVRPEWLKMKWNGSMAKNQAKRNKQAKQLWNGRQTLFGWSEAMLGCLACFIGWVMSSAPLRSSIALHQLCWFHSSSFAFCLFCRKRARRQPNSINFISFKKREGGVKLFVLIELIGPTHHNPQPATNNLWLLSEGAINESTKQHFTPQKKFNNFHFFLWRLTWSVDWTKKVL